MARQISLTQTHKDTLTELEPGKSYPPITWKTSRDKIFSWKLYFFLVASFFTLERMHTKILSIYSNDRKGKPKVMLTLR